MITNKLNRAKNLINNAIEQIKSAPEKEAVVELIEACQALDVQYKEWCKEQDEDTGEPNGTCYNEGTSMEFYIESDDWHNISLQLRKLNI